MSNVENIRNGKKVKEITVHLTDIILNGTLSAGERLYEKTLASQFGTSRGPIREALRNLETLGLVSIISNIGARVAYYTLSDFINLFVVRECLEGMAARLAAVLMSEQEKFDLRQLVETHNKIMIQSEGIFLQLSANSDFHDLVIRGAKNPLIFHSLCHNLYPLIKYCRSLYQHIPGRGQRSLIEHTRILETIEEGDGEMAEMTMRRHIAASRKTIESFFPDENIRLMNTELLKARPSFLNLKDFTKQ